MARTTLPDPLRVLAPAVGLGAGCGAAMGYALGALLPGAAFGAILGTAVALRPRTCTVPAADPMGQAGQAGQAGSVLRAMLWLVGGLALLGLLMVLIAPELLGTGVAGPLALVAFAAGIPGLLLLGVLIVRRRAVERDDVEG